MPNKIDLKLIVNGKSRTLQVTEVATLMTVLRSDLGLVGTKCGCNEGTCGSCTVIMNGKAVRSCTIDPKRMAGATVETIEGLSPNGRLHPLQTAFMTNHGCQCGFCTPGMIMAAKALLDKIPKPTDDEIKRGLRINLCRCTGYEQIIDSVKQASGQLPDFHDTYGLDMVGSPAQTDWVGRSIPRRDAKQLVTGRAEFTDDIPDPAGTLFLATKRSERAHALIESIDISKAENIPGVEKVITADDIPGENRYGKVIRDIPVLAKEKVLSYADAVALVVADSYETARKGCEAIEIKYKDLEPIFDPARALEPDAPKLHPKGNLLYEFNIIKGDADPAFDECAAIVEESFSLVAVDHAQLEPEAALAYFGSDGKLVIKAPTQHVFFDRLNIIRALGLPKDDVRVIQPSVGGAFGKREDVYGQIHCALAAMITRRPVRTVYSREETFQTTQKRHPAEIKVKVGAKADGTLHAFQAEVLADTGAYASWGQNILRKICVHISGPYNIPNVRVHGRAAYTNNVFSGAMRGFGTPQAVFASESALDMLAEKLNLDRLEIRKLNSFKPGSKTATGQVVTNTPGHKTIELAAEKCNWAVPLPEHETDPLRYKRGRGVASLWYGIGFGAGIPDRGNAIVEVLPDGTVKVFVSTVDYGQGSTTIFSQIAAETLGVTVEKVTMITGDSHTTPNCGSSVATRQTFITGNAIKNTCDMLAKDIREVAALLLETSPDSVRMSNDKVWTADQPERTFSASDVFAAFLTHGKPLRREGWFKGEQYTQPLDPITGQGNAYHPIAYGTQIAEVTVDTKTGTVKVDRIIACHYIGRALNPQAVRGQIIGGISMGWGYALSEDSLSVEGRIEAANFGKYRLMRTVDTPKHDVILLEDPEPTGPYGAIGIGEPPTVATAPAITNAICDAIGHRITKLPATPDKILAALGRK